MRYNGGMKIIKNVSSNVVLIYISNHFIFPTANCVRKTSKMTEPAPVTAAGYSGEVIYKFNYSLCWPPTVFTIPGNPAEWKQVIESEQTVWTLQATQHSIEFLRDPKTKETIPAKRGKRNENQNKNRGNKLKIKREWKGLDERGKKTSEKRKNHSDINKIN